MTSRNLHDWLRNDRAQDAVEYLIAVGTVVLVFVAAFYGFDAVVEAIVDFACPGIDTANGLAAVGSCITSVGP